MSKNSRFFTGFLFGASIAGAAALLFAPKSGKELRRDIAEEIDRLVDETEEYVDYMVERGVEMYDTASVAKDDIKVNLKETASQVKTQFKDVKEEAGHEWHRAKDELRKSKEELENSGEDASSKASHMADTVKEEAGDMAEDIQLTGEFLKDSAEESKENIGEEFDNM